MPNNAANRIAMRAPGQSIRCFASFITGKVLATGTVTFVLGAGSGLTRIDVQISFTTGAYTLLAYGMEVVFTDASGNFKGRTHIRYGGVITAGSFPVREYALGTLNIVATDKFIAYNEFRLHDKLVAATEAFPPDYLLYGNSSDANLHPDPIANSGGHSAWRLDSGQTYASVLMTGSTSRAVDPANVSGLAHSWTLPTGVTFAPGSIFTDANPTLRAVLGTHTINHAVTDINSSKVRVSHPMIRVHDYDSDPPHEVLINAYEASPENGWSWTVEVLSGDTSLSAIPDGCLAILWAEERINGAWQSFRNVTAGRKHILGVGYAARDTSSGEGTSGRHQITFEVVPPIQREKEITSYSKVMEESATPDFWSELYFLGVLRAILQIDGYYEMRCEAGFDLTVDSAFLDERYPAFYLDRDNFYNQKVGLATAVDARYVCDRTGKYDLHTEPPFIPLSDRAAVTVALTLEMEDILSYEFTREHFAKVEQYKASGFSGGTSLNAPYYSLYPGAAPGEGIDTPTRDKLILDATTPQTDLNARTGRYGALADMIFQDANGLKHQAFDLKLTLRGSYDCFDFYKEYVAVTISDNKRVIALTAFRFYVAAISMAFDPQFGTSVLNLTLRMETNAAPGETYIPPDDSLNYPSYEYPQFPFQELPSAAGTGILGRGTAELCVPSSDGSLYFLDLRTGDYTTVSLTASLTGTLSAAILNAFAPTGAVIATEQRAYTLGGLFTTQTVANSDAFPITGSALSMQSERGVSGLFVICLYRTANAGGSRHDVYVTPNGGVTWTDYTSQFGTWIGGSGDNYHPGCYVSPVGNIYTSGWSGAGVTTGILKKSTTQGASWSNVGSAFLYGLASDIHISFQDSAESLIFHGGSQVVSAVQRYRLYTTTSGGTRTDISPLYAAEKYGPVAPFGVTTCDIDANSVLCVGQDRDGGAASLRGVFLSRNRAATWTTLIVPATTVKYLSGRFAGDDRNTIFLYGDSGALAVSYDAGVTWREYTLGAGRLYNLFGKA